MSGRRQHRSGDALLRGIEYLLAGSVLAIALLLVMDVPWPFPTWPTIGPFPVDPELVLPGLLALVVLGDVVVEGFSVSSVPIGILALVTLGMATLSLYTLFAGQAGGVFWGGFFTLVLGTPLAIAVLARDVIRAVLSRNPFEPGK